MLGSTEGGKGTSTYLDACPEEPMMVTKALDIEIATRHMLLFDDEALDLLLTHWVKLVMK